ncbi:Serine acetyltransferase [Microcystis aeruginosa NIES-2549]|uniref:Serine acetyltransferase n=1 Tax=Microcystis aeruginosa NIES-2549 TaxID=1641812 RepID=A0A0F6RNG8_MICAE|nr:Serine acetyltransferase [Microcystis aeruginosa NIES-2549]
MWTKSVTVGAQSLRPPIDWDIIPTQVPNRSLITRFSITRVFIIYLS